jgi:UDP-N-acetylmuramoyl-tripeptide--D-alanyl-D-alanine ligase
MLELGAQSLELHRSMAERALALGLDGLVIVAQGPEGAVMHTAAAGLERLVRVDRPLDALQPLQSWLRSGDTVLLKASRGVALEQLLVALRAALAA